MKVVKIDIVGAKTLQRPRTSLLDVLGGAINGSIGRSNEAKLGGKEDVGAASSVVEPLPKREFS